MTEMSYTKPALTVSQQMEFLISQGLHIEDQKLDIRALETVSYYRLPSYLLPFKQSHNANSPRQFVENATFEQVWQLYQFDSELMKKCYLKLYKFLGGNVTGFPCNGFCPTPTLAS